MILEQLAMFDTAKVEIKKEHQLLMVSKTTSFQKGKGKKGYFMKRQISCCSSGETEVELKPQNSLSLNHMMMWTSLMTLVNSLDVGHMAM